MGHSSKIAQQFHIWPLHISSTLNDPLNTQTLTLVTYISPQLVNFAWNHFHLAIFCTNEFKPSKPCNLSILVNSIDLPLNLPLFFLLWFINYRFWWTFRKGFRSDFKKHPLKEVETWDGTNTRFMGIKPIIKVLWVKMFILSPKVLLMHPSVKIYWCVKKRGKTWTM